MNLLVLKPTESMYSYRIKTGHRTLTETLSVAKIDKAREFVDNIVCYGFKRCEKKRIYCRVLVFTCLN